MVGFKVSEEKEVELRALMQKLGVKEDDLEEQFIRGSGPGGQKINKTSSCVHLQHRRSGIEVKCQRSRSQSLNRYFARRELCERLMERLNLAQSKKRQEAERIRRQKRRRSRRQKEKLLQDKRFRKETKAQRRRVDISK
jgi:peptide chain release factor